MKCLFSRLIGPSLLSFIALATFSAHALPILSISPPVITNDYVGKIVLTITGLSAGQQVLVQRYADVNANGLIDPQEWLVQSFSVTDGVRPMIGGVRNINSPGDEDTAVNGQIRVELNLPGLNLVLDHIAGNYIYRVVDPLGGFAPVTAPFAIVQKAFPQGVTGTAYNAATGLPLSNAVVVMFPQNSDGGIGTFADATGHFVISNAPGNFGVMALQSGIVSDQSSGGVSISSNTFSTLNLTNYPATTSLNGRVADSSSGFGLPGIFVQAQNTNNLMVIGFTGTNGNYSLPVTADKWKLKVNAESGLMLSGYVAFENSSLSTNTFSGSASNLDFQFPKATALVYGHITDTQSNAVSTLAIDGQDNSYTYDGRGRSLPDGSYAVAVFGGNWSVGPNSDEMSANGYLGQSSNVSLTNGQALLVDLQIQRPTAHMRGHVVDGAGNPVGDIQMVVFLQGTNNGPPQVNLNARTQGDGSFDVGVFAGNWNLGLECESAASRGLAVPYIIVPVTDGVDRNNLTLAAPFVTGYISGTIHDNNGNPVNAEVYASLSINGTNYSACGGNGGSSFVLPVFNGTWNIGISGDLTSRGYDNPASLPVTVGGGTVNANITLYPLGQTPARLFGFSWANGQCSFQLSGSPERNYRIDVTTNLTNPSSWIPLRTNVAYGGSFMFFDNNAPPFPPRFYRAVLMP